MIKALEEIEKILTNRDYLTSVEIEKILDDPKLVAGKESSKDGSKIGNSNGANIQRLSELKEKANMFVHGAPDSFIQSMTATLGVGAQKAQSMSESQNNLMYAIDTNRISVSLPEVGNIDPDDLLPLIRLVFPHPLENGFRTLFLPQVSHKKFHQQCLFPGKPD